MLHCSLLCIVLRLHTYTRICASSLCTWVKAIGHWHMPLSMHVWQKSVAGKARNLLKTTQMGVLALDGMLPALWTISWWDIDRVVKNWR